MDALKTYLDSKWYAGHDDMGWYDSHFLQGETYSGYWSFESVALVKRLNVWSTKRMSNGRLDLPEGLSEVIKWIL
ncbi:PoNe immunity protein domain-containing protein [Listeria booriae]|uniref:PoNe immunity protein domain-containing protein n=1 Tax=Listeria booriae TaxID=1552123 RepID=UPI001C8A13D5|nr:PoNe immunity protein domain-containing protein [Listeria booriae]